MAIDVENRRETDEPEPLRVYFRSLFQWTDEYTKIRKYLRTRKEVLSGALLYDQTSGDLERADLMGPLTFNVYETALAALPSQGVVAIIWFFSSMPVDSPVLLEPTTPLSDVYASSLSELLPKLQALVAPLIVPSTALAIGWLAALLSLRRSDWTRKKLRRARDAFFYYDGAHGLIPECALALLFTVAPFVSAALAQLVLLGLAFFAYAAARQTEDSLASANGYSTGPYESALGFGFAELSPAFPRKRYRGGLAIMAWPVAFIVALVLYIAAFVVASGLSLVRAWVQTS